MYIDHKAGIDELVEKGKFTEDGTCTICGVGIIGATAQETFEAQEAHAKEHKTIKIEVEGFEVIEKTVKAQGNAGRVYLPVSWVGKKVKVLLVEEL
jgi:putative transposon-encoded protein